MSFVNRWYALPRAVRPLVVGALFGCAAAVSLGRPLALCLVIWAVPVAILMALEWRRPAKPK